MPESQFELPPPQHRLDLQLLRQTPRETGVYAAWITDESALVELGVTGQTPFLLYVGKAAGRGGLRQRLRRHVQAPWYEVSDLLAARSRVLPMWWRYADKVVNRRVPPVTPLAQVASDQALMWQHQHVLWGWRGVPASQAGAIESDLIERHLTLLNRRGRGYAKHGSPQLRAVGEDTAARAWWLFHAAWIAVLDQQPAGWSSRGLRGLRVASDDAGWPTLLGEGTERTIRVPTERAARKLLAGCAPTKLREAAGMASEADEARAWWAAYAAKEFLPRPQSVEDALRGALLCNAAGRHAPKELPGTAQLAQLDKLIAVLPGLAH